uniref:Uncharacterized protein n=1 Tax=Phaeomonas parva TaxID=124430 RepID=A0A7S1XTT9_9STRA|mmetsp:Transcript_36686/g.114899  ORF Transcript_36686/g.114899 Transcript_36686/m.114899 type:complete len:164 (+) Transcript_36686:196-687(+)
MAPPVARRRSIGEMAAGVNRFIRRVSAATGVGAAPMPMGENGALDEDVHVQLSGAKLIFDHTEQVEIVEAFARVVAFFEEDAEGNPAQPPPPGMSPDWYRPSNYGTSPTYGENGDERWSSTSSPRSRMRWASRGGSESSGGNGGAGGAGGAGPARGQRRGQRQ